MKDKRGVGEDADEWDERIGGEPLLVSNRTHQNTCELKQLREIKAETHRESL
jgi:hypothetical protein